MEQNEVTQLDKKKIAIIVIAIVVTALAILAGVYVYVANHFTGHFHMGTKIGDVDVSGMTAEEADAALQKKFENYKLTIYKKGGETEAITADEVGLKFSWVVSPADYLAKQNGYEWIVKKYNPDTYEMQGYIACDEALLSNRIMSLELMKPENQIPSIDATISAYDKEKGYTLVPAVWGTEFNKTKFYTVVKESILALNETMDMNQGGIYLEPQIKDDNENLLAAIDKLNKCLASKITYQVGGQTQVLDAETFQPWISLNENYEVVIDDAAVTAYVKGLASKYNTYYSPKKFMTSYGQEITISNSNYGWRVDNAAEKAAIITEIKAGSSVTRDLKYTKRARNRSAQEYGNSYVEINLTAQHLFLYVNGQCIWESDFISGNVSKGWDTPPGIFGLSYKTRNATLRGADYAVPVSYWMPFNGNVGMHDATYKSDFGGNYYKTQGSHGCVNLPLETAKTLYAHVSANFPIIVYKLPGTESEKCIAQDQAAAMDRAILAIGNVTLQSEAAITSCRARYDALSDMAKKYVKYHGVLVNAEKALEGLKNASTISID